MIIKLDKILTCAKRTISCIDVLLFNYTMKYKALFKFFFVFKIQPFTRSVYFLKGISNVNTGSHPLSTSKDFVKFDYHPNCLCVQPDNHNCSLGSIMSCMRLVDALVSKELNKKWIHEQQNTNHMTTAMIPTSVLPEAFTDEASSVPNGKIPMKTYLHQC